MLQQGILEYNELYYQIHQSDIRFYTITNPSILKCSISYCVDGQSLPLISGPYIGQCKATANNKYIFSYRKIFDLISNESIQQSRYPIIQIFFKPKLGLFIQSTREIFLVQSRNGDYKWSKPSPQKIKKLEILIEDSVWYIYCLINTNNVYEYRTDFDNNNNILELHDGKFKDILAINKKLLKIKKNQLKENEDIIQNQNFTLASLEIYDFMSLEIQNQCIWLLIDYYNKILYHQLNDKIQKIQIDDLSNDYHTLRCYKIKKSSLGTIVEINFIQPYNNQNQIQIYSINLNENKRLDLQYKQELKKNIHVLFNENGYCSPHFQDIYKEIFPNCAEYTYPFLVFKYVITNLVNEFEQILSANHFNEPIIKKLSKFTQYSKKICNEISNELYERWEHTNTYDQLYWILQNLKIIQVKSILLIKNEYSLYKKINKNRYEPQYPEIIKFHQQNLDNINKIIMIMNLIQGKLLQDSIANLFSNFKEIRTHYFNIMLQNPRLCEVEFEYRPFMDHFKGCVQLIKEQIPSKKQFIYCLFKCHIFEVKYWVFQFLVSKKNTWGLTDYQIGLFHLIKKTEDQIIKQKYLSLIQEIIIDFSIDQQNPQLKAISIFQQQKFQQMNMILQSRQLPQIVYLYFARYAVFHNKKQFLMALLMSRKIELKKYYKFIIKVCRIYYLMKEFYFLIGTIYRPSEVFYLQIFKQFVSECSRDPKALRKIKQIKMMPNQEEIVKKLESNLEQSCIMSDI